MGTTASDRSSRSPPAPVPSRRSPASTSPPRAFDRATSCWGPTAPSTTGSNPTGIVNDGGTLVGVTSGGGPTNHGTIFTVNPNTLRLSTPILFNDASSPNTGGAPAGVSFKDAAGNLYGASFEGGGTV